MVKRVFLESDVFMVCLNHALSTEKEEVMGLLIGEVNVESKVSTISAVIVLRRSDKRPDRVEISPEQLSDASTQAENNRVQLVCFQAVGPSATGESHQYQQIEVPIHVTRTAGISRTCLKSVIDLPSVLRQEEEDAYGKTTQLPTMDVLSQLHNSAVFTKSLCHITEVSSVPLLQMLTYRQETRQEQIKNLKREKEQLAKLLKRR